MLPKFILCHLLTHCLNNSSFLQRQMFMFQNTSCLKITFHTNCVTNLCHNASNEISCSLWSKMRMPDVSPTFKKKNILQTCVNVSSKTLLTWPFLLRLKKTCISFALWIHISQWTYLSALQQVYLKKKLCHKMCVTMPQMKSIAPYEAKCVCQTFHQRLKKKTFYKRV